MMGSPSMNGGVEKPFVAVTKMEPLDSTGQNLPEGRGPQRISISALFFFINKLSIEGIHLEQVWNRIY